LSLDDLREWIEDFVAANRAATYEQCVAAMIAEGFAIQRAGTRRLWELWDTIKQETFFRRVRG
jgi:hypothetical protein